VANVTDVDERNGVALVVGGASGIGRACVEALEDDGWDVVVADLKPDRRAPHGVVVDVRDRDAVEAAIEQVLDAHDRLGTVVYAAGTARVTSLLDIDAAEWELVIGVNLTGAFNVLQSCAAHIAPGGSFTFISSVDSLAPVGGLAHYSAAKAGGEALVRSAALELGHLGIRCNAVLPGVVRTPLMAQTLDRPGITEAFIERTPLGRIGAGEDIASVVAFLASPAARWISGVSLPVDGGMSLREHPALLDGALSKPNARKDNA
jgi:NAD(P)-dependent dehydrogenase (short-subunit alcohol dehydrogenase family)